MNLNVMPLEAIKLRVALRTPKAQHVELLNRFFRMLYGTRCGFHFLKYEVITSSVYLPKK